MIVLMLLLAAGCAGMDRSEVDSGAGAPDELGSTLNVRAEGDSVRLVLHITNTTSGPLTVEFASTQRYDFAVDGRDGTSLWRWSAARSFAQMLGEEVLAAGESRQYEAVWVAPAGGGEYVATAWLTSTNYPVELRTEFETGSARGGS